MYLYPRIWADSEKPCENWAFMGNHPSPIISLPWFHFHHSSFTRLGFAVAYELDTLVEGGGGQHLGNVTNRHAANHLHVHVVASSCWRIGNEWSMA